MPEMLPDTQRNIHFGNTPPSNQQINLQLKSLFCNQPYQNQPYWNPYPQQNTFNQFSQLNAFTQFLQQNVFSFGNPNSGSQIYTGCLSSQPNINQPMSPIPYFNLDKMYSP